MSRTRNIVFTINNYSKGCIAAFREAYEDISNYCVIGKEVGEQGTHHLQGYIELKNAMTFTAFNKRFSPKKVHGYARCEARRGTPQEAAEYCKKDGRFVEWGEPGPGRGTRSDLQELVDDIRAGALKVDDIATDNATMYHKYGRTLHKIEDLYMRDQRRTEMTTGIWYFGTTGVGKSHTAFTSAKPRDIYNWKKDKGWQDGYTQQPIVVINDFRGHIPYDEMLQMVDKWPFEVPRRGREPCPFTSEKVIITSALPPWEVYHNRAAGDDIAQLLRRFCVIRLLPRNLLRDLQSFKPTSICTEVVGGGNNDPPSEAPIGPFEL